jgi:hypothetical protein
MATKKPPIDNKCLRRTFRSNAAFIALGDIVSFQSGGCWIAARAIQREYGGTLMLVASDRSPAEHVVVEKDGIFYDSVGAQTKEQLLRRMAREEWVPNPRVTPYDRRVLGKGMPVSESLARRIQALLRSCPRK